MQPDDPRRSSSERSPMSYLDDPAIYGDPAVNPWWLLAKIILGCALVAAIIVVAWGALVAFSGAMMP